VDALQLVGAHTDSPCLKLKPNPVKESDNCLQLGVAVYGGALLGPWFDRDLSLAGRVGLAAADSLQTVLVDFQRPLAIIPSLAIHLDREANKKKEINKQNDLVPIIGLNGDGREGFLKILQQQVVREHPGLDNPDISDFELFLYDATPPARTGLDRELITGARLDNLVSCFAALQALLAPDVADNSFIVLSDHEEVGSVSTSGAQGSFLLDVLERLLPDAQQRKAVLRNSLLISADNAHGVHPNFASRHDPQHQPLMERGPVIKFNANQRYATNAATATRFRQLCREAGVPVQEFVMRSDLACGSTIGPLTAAATGIDTVDGGIPSLALHSIRETAACRDCWYLYRVLAHFLGARRD
jgi:aspartyl aminopeptidase